MRKRIEFLKTDSHLVFLRLLNRDAMEDVKKIKENGFNVTFQETMSDPEYEKVTALLVIFKKR